TAALLASESEAAIGETFLISAAAPVTWRAFFGGYERMAGRDAVGLMDDAQLQAESRRVRAQRRWSRRVYNGFARRPELRARLLALPPHSWLLRGGQALLPRAVQDSINSWYDQFWRTPPSKGPHLYVPDPSTRALYASRTHVRIDK